MTRKPSQYTMDVGGKPARAKPRKIEMPICKAFVSQVERIAELGKVAPHFFIFHITNELPRMAVVPAWSYAKLRQHFKEMGKVAGVSDYFITWRGHTGQDFGFLEAKAPDGTLNPAQKEFRAFCEGAGIHWSEFRDVTEGLRHLQTWGALRTSF